MSKSHARALSRWQLPSALPSATTVPCAFCQEFPAPCAQVIILLLAQWIGPLTAQTGKTNNCLYRCFLYCGSCFVDWFAPGGQESSGVNSYFKGRFYGIAPTPLTLPSPRPCLPRVPPTKSPGIPQPRAASPGHAESLWQRRDSEQAAQILISLSCKSLLRFLPKQHL